MKSSASILNFARGAVIDQPALVEALIQSLFYVIMVHAVPVHDGMLFAFLTVMIVRRVVIAQIVVRAVTVQIVQFVPVAMMVQILVLLRNKNLMM